MKSNIAEEVMNDLVGMMVGNVRRVAIRLSIRNSDCYLYDAHSRFKPKRLTDEACEI